MERVFFWQVFCLLYDCIKLYYILFIFIFCFKYEKQGRLKVKDETHQPKWKSKSTWPSTVFNHPFIFISVFPLNINGCIWLYTCWRLTHDVHATQPPSSSASMQSICRRSRDCVLVALIEVVAFSCGGDDTHTCLLIHCLSAGGTVGLIWMSQQQAL